jgi:hypothetical protein
MKVEVYSKKNKKDVVYPTHLSALRPISDKDVPTDSVEDLGSSLRVKTCFLWGLIFNGVGTMN